MKLLANFVTGTDAEYLLPKQLDDVNKARGLKPDNEGYLKPDDLLDREPEEAENDQAEEIKEEQEEREIFI